MSGEVVRLGIGAVFLVLLAVLFVNVWNFHATNMSLCATLGGQYDSWDGTGQCIKDQVILFDPRHPYDDE